MSFHIQVYGFKRTKDIDKLKLIELDVDVTISRTDQKVKYESFEKKQLVQKANINCFYNELAYKQLCFNLSFQ